MSVINNRKILLGSVLKSLNDRLVLGDSGNNSLILLTLLVKYYQYCLDQLNNGVEEYRDKIKVINNLIYTLKSHCSNVCNYKDRYVYIPANTPPVIDNNTIFLPISNEFQKLLSTEVIKNFSDAEADLLSRILIPEKESNSIFKLNDEILKTNVEYQPPYKFEVKYGEDKDFYLLQNNREEPCTANIIRINEDVYNQFGENPILNIHEDGSTIFQTISENIKEIPNDTTIYAHIDTSSMSYNDQITLKDIILSWWSDFRLNNPDFNGELIMNILNHDEIDNPNPPVNNVSLPTDILFYPLISGDIRECWLNTPALGLLQSRHRNYPKVDRYQTLQEFVQDIKGKSLVVLNFTDETHSDYTEAYVEVLKNPFKTDGVYKEHYDNFIKYIHPNLKFFKGTLYPITRATILDSTATGTNFTFLAHAIASIEGEVVPPSKVDALIGQEKKQRYSELSVYSSTLYIDALYDLLNRNEYSTTKFPKKLKDIGWAGVFDKLSPASEVFSSTEFEEELNDLLTNTENVVLPNIELISVPSENLGDSVNTGLKIKAEDNNPYNPLYSEVKNIDVVFTSYCEDTPSSCGEMLDLSILHGETAVFSTMSDFTSDPNVDKIKILSIEDSLGGGFYYHGALLSNSILPVIVTKDDLENNKFTFVPNDSIVQAYAFSIAYELSLEGTINFCNRSNILAIHVEAEPNVAPIASNLEETLTISNDYKSSDFNTLVQNSFTDINGDSISKIAIKHADNNLESPYIKVNTDLLTGSFKEFPYPLSNFEVLPYPNRVSNVGKDYYYFQDSYVGGTDILFAENIADYLINERQIVITDSTNLACTLNFVQANYLQDLTPIKRNASKISSRRNLFTYKVQDNNQNNPKWSEEKEFKLNWIPEYTPPPAEGPDKTITLYDRNDYIFSSEDFTLEENEDLTFYLHFPEGPSNPTFVNSTTNQNLQGFPKSDGRLVGYNILNNLKLRFNAPYYEAHNITILYSISDKRGLNSTTTQYLSFDLRKAYPITINQVTTTYLVTDTAIPEVVEGSKLITPSPFISYGVEKFLYFGEPIENGETSNELHYIRNIGIYSVGAGIYPTGHTLVDATNNIYTSASTKFKIYTNLTNTKGLITDPLSTWAFNKNCSDTNNAVDANGNATLEFDLSSLKITNKNNIYILCFADNQLSFYLNDKIYFNGGAVSDSDHGPFKNIHMFKVRQEDVLDGINRIKYVGYNLKSECCIGFAMLEGNLDEIMLAIEAGHLVFNRGNPMTNFSFYDIKEIDSTSRRICTSSLPTTTCPVGNYESGLNLCVEKNQVTTITRYEEVQIKIALELSSNTSNLNIYVKYGANIIYAKRPYVPGMEIDFIHTFTEVHSKLEVLIENDFGLVLAKEDVPINVVEP